MKPDKKLTIEEVGKALHISKTTVSRALSGKGRVNEATKARILEYIQQSGCQVGVSLPEQDSSVTHNLALVIPYHFMQLDLPFLRKCMGGVCRMAAQREYDVLLCYADDIHTDQLERQLATGKVDGVLLSRALKQDPCIDLLRRYDVPFVVLGRQEDASILQVDNDQTIAAAEMTRLLMQSGMRRIAYLGGNLNYMVNADRLTGYLQALEEAGMEPEPGLIFSGVETEEQRLDAMEAVLEQKPECLLCCDDSMALFARKLLRQRGIAIPEQMRLASLYDSEMLQDTRPPVSAVHYDAGGLGTAACRLLLDSIAGKSVPARIVQGHQVILRESTK